MGVIIQNVSTHDDLIGANDYVLRINEREIVRFQHVRAAGLAACLRAAADAVEAARPSDGEA